MTRYSRHQALVFPAKKKTKVLARPELNFSILFALSRVQSRDPAKESETRLQSDRSTSALSRHLCVFLDTQQWGVETGFMYVQYVQGI